MHENILPRRTLDTTGKALISAEPDICCMSFSVETENKNASRAYKENNLRMNKIIEQVQSLGVADTDIKTMNFSIFPTYKTVGSSSRPVIDAYRIFHYLYIKVRELEKASSILDSVIEAGATGVNYISFTIEDMTKQTEDARIRALKDARAKAEKTAQVLGFKLGKPVSIREQPSGHRYRAGARNEVEMAAQSVQKEANLQPGEVKMNYQVYVTWEIE